jgi:hypothetical protein
MKGVMFMQTDNDPWSFFTAPGSNAKGVLLVVGIVIVFTVIFFAWAAYVRTPRKSHRHYHSDEHGSERRKRSGSSRLFGRKHHHRRRRSSHRERPTNPTLSQIGGLPPRRDSENPPH